MSFIDRVLGRETKTSAAKRLIALSLGSRAAWTPRDYAALAREGFARNPVAHRCVRLIAEAAAAAPLKVLRGGEVREDDPAAEMLAQPNPDQSGAELLEDHYGYLQVAGNAYLELAALDGMPRELFALRPDRMRVLPGPRGWPDGWEYTAGGRSVRFARDRANGQSPILHSRLFHPSDDHYGLSPLEAAAAAVDVHNAGGAWAKALLDNAARPSGALVVTAKEGEGRLTDEQYERLKAELSDAHAGPSNAGRPMLLEGGLDWKPMALTPADMDFSGARREAAREIALAFGVPPMLLGLPGDNTYANYREANLALPDTGFEIQAVREDVAALPADLRVHFIDDDGEYSRAAVFARNRLGSGRGVADLAIPLLADAGQAEDWAVSALRRLAGESETFTFNLPPSALAIEAGDVVRLSRGETFSDLVLLDLSGDTQRGASGVPLIEQAAGFSGSAPATPRGEIRTPSKAEMLVLDLPLTDGEDSRAGPLVAVSATPWYGVAALHAGSEANNLTRRGLSRLPTAMGVLLGALASAPAGRLIEQTVPIRLHRGGLENISLNALLSGANRMAIETGEGWEVLQFRYATLISDSVWEVSGLLRGQFGSEVATSVDAGARLALLGPELSAIAVYDHEFGEDLLFKAGPARFGAGHGAYASEVVAVERADLRPLSPVHLHAERTGDMLSVRWIRRTRIGGDLWSPGDVPLGETSERYVLRAGPIGGALLSFETDVPAWSIDPASETALFGGTLSGLEIEVRQVSQRYGTGRAASGVFVL